VDRKQKLCLDTAQHEGICTFMIVSRHTRLKMRNVSDKSCRENQNTFYMQLFFPKTVSFEILWENMVEPGWPQMAVWRMLDNEGYRHTLVLCIACFLLFHGNRGYGNMPQWQVIRTLSLLLVT
jgi:hypothetical protein